MSRQAVERLTGRMYQHYLKQTGRLPGSEEIRSMEDKAKKIAERAERGKSIAHKKARSK